MLAPAFGLSAHAGILVRSISSPKICEHRTVERRGPCVVASTATDEIAKCMSQELNLGKVTSMSRAGSSGWAVMHKATTDTGSRFFIKVSRDDAAMFAGEANGLSAMFKTGTIRVPEVFHYGSLRSTQGSFIIMESLELLPVYSQYELGLAVAAMHCADPAHAEAKAGMFGFAVNNTIGATPQPNGWMDNWVDFFRERRLRHQLLLVGDDHLLQLGDIVCDKMEMLFEVLKDDIKPSILHGDLWSGNIAGCGGEPTVFDPASYYGHHEAEFGMSWCAGFSAAFWDGYNSVIPRAPGFEDRQKLYQLYHYLNHYNLFGGGYYSMAESILQDLVRTMTGKKVL